MLRAGSKSFHLASRLLPRRVRAPTFALYAFCRHADDAVDDASSDRAARAAVDSLRARVDRVYAGRALDSLVERAFFGDKRMTDPERDRRLAQQVRHGWRNAEPLANAIDGFLTSEAMRNAYEGIR